MSGNIHALTNLSAGHSFHLTVPVGGDIAAAAKAYLADKDLPFEVQEGFFVSVYPTGFDDSSSGAARLVDGQLVANAPANLDSSPNGTPYDS